MLNVKKYEILSQLSLANGKTIYVLDSFINGSRIKEIYKKEVVQHDSSHATVDWVISIPDLPKNEYFWRDNKHGDIDDHDRFVSVSTKDGKYYAKTFKGLIFELNIDNGEAIFQYQARD